MKIFAILGAALALTACGANPQTQWDRQTLVYNALAERAIELREPCVTDGPDAPGCIFKDDAYSKFRIVQTTADGYLKAAEIQIASDNESKAKFYLTAAAGALLALSDQLGQPAPELEE